MARQPITILVASDWAPIRAFEPIVRADPEAVYGDLLPALRVADLRIVNCECALTAATREVWKSGSVFKGQPRHVRALTAVPFDVACLANNHVLDYGVRGLRDTLNALHRGGIRTVGAGLSEDEAYEPLRLSIDGTPVCIVNFSEGENLTEARGGPGVFGWDIARAASLVERGRKQGAVVIAIGHCGLEYVPSPPPYVAAAFHALVDAGAHAVVGHHPHVPQGIEWYRGRPIVYSLGNFVFYQPADLAWRRTGFCVALRFAGARLSKLDLLPYRIEESGLRGLTVSERTRFDRKMRALSDLVKSPASAAAAWQAYLRYYGAAGFEKEVRGILEKMSAEPRKAAAMFRNRITTMQHRELWRDLLTRMMDGGREGYSREAYRIVEEWFTRPASARPTPFDAAQGNSEPIEGSRTRAAASRRPSRAADRR